MSVLTHDTAAVILPYFVKRLGANLQLHVRHLDLSPCGPEQFVDLLAAAFELGQAAIVEALNEGIGNAASD